MIDREEAYKIAREYVNTYHDLKPYHDVGDNDSVVILEEETVERSCGWIFFYQSRLWVQTKKHLYRMVNNYPIIVDRLDGRVSYFDMENGIDAGVEYYEKNRHNRDKPGYYELYDFLACYMRADNGVGDFPSEEAAVLYYITHNKPEKVNQVIEEGTSILKEKDFPWEEIVETTEISFKNSKETQKWLTTIIELMKSARLQKESQNQAET